jgi:hypothetical protein
MGRRIDTFPWALAFWLACATATAFYVLGRALQDWQLTMN